MVKHRLGKINIDTIIRRANGRCECDRMTHDHNADYCHRKPRYFVYKVDSPHVALPDCVILVCSSCRSQIKLEKGIIS